MARARSLRSISLAFLVTGTLVTHVACSDDSGGADAGFNPDAAPMDASAPYDSGVMDSGARDSGVRDASTPRDAGFECIENDSVQVGATTVRVGATSMPTLASGASADLSCEVPTMGTFSDPIFLRGCLNVVGAAPSAAELAQLDVAVFKAFDAENAPVDPSFDPATFVDRQPDARIPLDIELDTTVSTCPSGVQFTMGLDAPVSAALGTETEYVLRVRTATTTGAAVWATAYYPGLIARNGAIESTLPGECTTQSCYAVYNVTVMRASTLATFAGQATPAIPGAADLEDGRGAGYGLIETFDCNSIPMQYATAGFSPTPLADGYVAGAALDLAATESAASGLYLALGFTSQTAANDQPLAVTGAVGADSVGACTEEFAGRVVTVYPDSITVLRTSRENVLHDR
ncbi:hypothetical protein L6R52_07995 [Myxococcota bacterium]|nr:hypothetical protein [Myxococcota bacterium]